MHDASYYWKINPLKRRNRSHCPISFALDIFGDAWTLLILRDLIFKGKSRYQEFLASEERISTNILAERLARLEEHGIISRAEDPANRKQILYSPTKKGLDLVPVLLEIIRWSGKHDEETAAPKEFLDQLKKDPEGLKEAIRAPFTRPSKKGRA